MYYSQKPDEASEECTCIATALIAEDEYFNLYPMTSKFNEKEITYDIAGNGQLAVQMFKKNLEKTCCDLRYKIIFTDVNMPVLGGLEAANQIRSYLAEKEQPLIPIIASTAYDAAAISEIIQDPSICDYIQKPYN
jgi:CheY-like chemotaxis protein